jgi:hypothetical protein
MCNLGKGESTRHASLLANEFGRLQIGRQLVVRLRGGSASIIRVAQPQQGL